VRVIQIDEAALREGLPLRRSQWQHYLDWAVESFRITANGVTDETQIHTHMCYSEFNDISAAQHGCCRPDTARISLIRLWPDLHKLRRRFGGTQPVFSWQRGCVPSVYTA